MSILGAIVGGLIVGLLARFILPGRQNLSLPITAAIGIVAALIGWWVAGLLGVQSTSGVDWLRWIISIIIAAVGIVGYGAVTKKS
ncbi:MAG: GlsB/YeaQ/YmgE family stress response membrane protein [Actinomycetales bacterium]|nr:GlsB/YeaQ/YmgE family stress response membrane protein [Candidatus Phosphoribacter baldrii]